MKFVYWVTGDESPKFFFIEDDMRLFDLFDELVQETLVDGEPSWNQCLIQLNSETNEVSIDFKTVERAEITED